MAKKLIALLVFCALLGFVVGRLGFDEWQAVLVLLLVLTAVAGWLLRMALSRNPRR